MNESSESGAGAASEKAREIPGKVGALDSRDRMILFGSAALVLLFLFPWWSFSVNLLGIEESLSRSGLRGLAWVGFIAAVAASVTALANMGLLPFFPADARRLCERAGVQVGITAVALLAGPIYFWSQSSGAMWGGTDGMVIYGTGKTFFFWLALLAALTAAMGAGWKMVAPSRS